MSTAGFCDLHMHSSASDGTDAPQDLPRLVKQAGLKAFALTDHDTTAGLPAAAEAAKRLRIPFVPGIELSANPDLHLADAPIGTLHILGYFIRHDDDHLATIQLRLHDARAQRNPEMIAKLNDLGVKITYDEVIERASSTRPGVGEKLPGVVGRPHIAQVLVDKGYARSIHEAFNKYVGMHGAAYVRKDLLSAKEAIDAIHHASGLAAFAHPVQYHRTQHAQIEHALKRLIDLGIDAIETRHSDHDAAEVQRFEKLAERFNLLTTGGSDYHGSRKSVPLGAANVPMTVYEALKARATTRK